MGTCMTFFTLLTRTFLQTSHVLPKPSGGTGKRWTFPFPKGETGKKEGVFGPKDHFLLQGIVPTQESKPGLLHHSTAGRFFTT